MGDTERRPGLLQGFGCSGGGHPPGTLPFLGLSGTGVPHSAPPQLLGESQSLPRMFQTGFYWCKLGVWPAGWEWRRPPQKDGGHPKNLCVTPKTGGSPQKISGRAKKLGDAQKCSGCPKSLWVPQKAGGCPKNPLATSGPGVAPRVGGEDEEGQPPHPFWVGRAEKGGAGGFGGRAGVCLPRSWSRQRHLERVNSPRQPGHMDRINSLFSLPPPLPSAAPGAAPGPCVPPSAPSPSRTHRTPLGRVPPLSVAVPVRMRTVPCQVVTRRCLTPQRGGPHAGVPTEARCPPKPTVPPPGSPFWGGVPRDPPCSDPIPPHLLPPHGDVVGDAVPQFPPPRPQPGTAPAIPGGLRPSAPSIVASGQNPVITAATPGYFQGKLLKLASGMPTPRRPRWGHRRPGGAEVGWSCPHPGPLG